MKLLSIESEIERNELIYHMGEYFYQQECLWNFQIKQLKIEDAAQKKEIAELKVKNTDNKERTKKIFDYNKMIL